MNRCTHSAKPTPHAQFSPGRILLFLLLSTCISIAENKPTEDNKRASLAREALSNFVPIMEKAMNDFNLPGLAMAVVAGGEVVFAEGVGFRNIEDQLPMTADTLFAIGSTTKAMTATVLGILVDEGKIDWDTPLNRYLPSFRLSDPLASLQITTRDILTHRSGLPRHDFVWYNNNQTTRAELVSRLPHLEMTESLRSKYQYNNLMYLTAGHLTEQMMKAEWEECITQKLFQPLEMKRTNLSTSNSQEDPNHALPYQENDEGELELIPFRNIDLIGPAGSVNSSVREMTHWLRLNLAKGEFQGRRLIEQPTINTIHSPQMPTGTVPSHPEISTSVYAMGWGRDTYRGHQRLGHLGGIDGFITSVMFFPDDDLGIVAFANRGSGIALQLSQEAADCVLNLKAMPWVEEALEKRKKTKANQDKAKQKKQALKIPNTQPSHPINDYRGTYTHPGYGSLDITGEDTRLSMRFNDISAPLEHWHYDVWTANKNQREKAFEHQKLLFRSNVDGQISSVEIQFEPRAAAIVFKKSSDVRMSDPAYLARYTGSYQLENSNKLTIAVTGNKLTATFPGQPVYTLEATLDGNFVVQESKQVRVGFKADESGQITTCVLMEPTGVFEAKRTEPD